jgi:PS-10 peptidase S37
MDRKQAVVRRMLFAVWALSACGAGLDVVEANSLEDAVEEDESSLASTETPEQVMAALQRVPGLTVSKLPVDVPTPTGKELGFLLELIQPVDHFDPSKGTFKQRAILLHRGFKRPMVLESTGYGLFYGLKALDSEPSYDFEANDVLVEHRFFETSTPTPTDWKYCDIRQSAFDYHRFVQALKPLYKRKWISTGISKGGMTVVYHRRFFPNDVVGTVAYVAPQSYGYKDPRYNSFLSQVGSQACREKLVSVQRAALKRRDELLPFVVAQGKERGYTFDIVPLELSFESQIVAASFTFWQYSNEAACSRLPSPDAPAAEFYAALDEVVGFASSASDQTYKTYEAYGYQAYTQLGAPGSSFEPLRDLLKFPASDDYYRSQVPIQLPPFEYRSVPEVQWILERSGERYLFIYGENDPWTAGQFRLGAAKDSAKYIVPNGNHSAAIFDLPDADKADAQSRLTRWFGVQPRPVMSTTESARSLVGSTDLTTPWRRERSLRKIFELNRK